MGGDDPGRSAAGGRDPEGIRKRCRQVEVDSGKESGVTTEETAELKRLKRENRAANHGLLYVLSMVVIGGLVGGGSLGYIVVSGFAQDQLFGEGLAAGVAITAMGIMLDRIARHASTRIGRQISKGHRIDHVPDSSIGRSFKGFS